VQAEPELREDRELSELEPERLEMLEPESTEEAGLALYLLWRVACSS
jgi:hypothetical protein